MKRDYNVEKKNQKDDETGEFKKWVWINGNLRCRE
jgi:hypothetical protein